MNQSLSVRSLPVHVITGFLGSAKTTLIQRLLASPEFAATAVLINEFGEVGLDHLLVETVDEGIVLLQSGCVCSTIRGDFSKAILDLYSRRERGLVPWFARVAVETTGLADPMPVLSTILHDPLLRHHFHVGRVIVAIDSVNGLANLEQHPETVKQAAVADRLVTTKTDLAGAGSLNLLSAALRRLNPAATLHEAVRGELDASLLLGDETWDEEARSTEAQNWLADEAEAPLHERAQPLDRSRHAHDIRAFCVTLDRPVDWAAFGVWLTLLLHRHGNAILRVKGVLDIAGSDVPVVVQGVQHLVHNPTHLQAWPFADRRSRLVFIARGLDEATVRRSLECFQSLGAMAKKVG